jgi:hypothetical protein
VKGLPQTMQSFSGRSCFFTFRMPVSRWQRINRRCEVDASSYLA